MRQVLMTVVAAVGLLAWGCGPSGGGGGGGTVPLDCQDGDIAECTCDDGLSGEQLCISGSYGACECEPELQGDFALGRLSLSEFYGDDIPSTVSVSGVFLPDASDYQAPQRCSTAVDGSCEVLDLPECPGGCEAGAFCAFNDSCEPRCTTFCDLDCPAGEECYFPAPGAPACRPVDGFHAGTLVFDGLTEHLELAPPYLYTSPAGVTVLPSGGGEASVAAAGADAAPGFDAFDVSFATPPRVSSSDLEVTEQGDGSWLMEWTGAGGQVVVEVTPTGQNRTLICTGNDNTGELQISSTALSEVDMVSGASVRLRRTATTTRAGLDLLAFDGDEGEDGELAHTSGTLHVEVSQTLNTLVVLCGPGTDVCDDTCVDTQQDPMHCGGCNNECGGNEACFEGSCLPLGSSCDQCGALAMDVGGECHDTFSDCMGDWACVYVVAQGCIQEMGADFETCQELQSCFSGCAGDEACGEACIDTHVPDGDATNARLLANVQCHCYQSRCVDQCASACVDVPQPG